MDVVARSVHLLPGQGVHQSRSLEHQGDGYRDDGFVLGRPVCHTIEIIGLQARFVKITDTVGVLDWSFFRSCL